MRYPWIITACMIAGLTLGVQADDQAFVETSRRTLNEYSAAVIDLSATTKIDVGQGKVQEQRVHCPGIVIDTNGLIVTALNRMDPTPLIVRSIKERNPNLNPSVTVNDIKITWADGTETPGRIVLKDADLDLAFVLPDFPEGTTCTVTTPIPLKDNGSAQIFDRIISLGRLEEQYQRKPLVIEGRIATIIEKPRRLYYVQSTIPGAPIFTETGHFLGLVVTRVSKQEESSSVRIFILPAEDILEVSLQVYDDDSIH